jgi:predicted transcriptional regulator
MTTETTIDSSIATAHAANIVAAYVSKNSISATDLPSLIASVHGAIVGLATPAIAEADRPEPAVKIKSSITPDYIVCLEDGMKFKSLKRHLRTAYKMTPEDYRKRWNLPADYPMVAPNYSERRSQLAKDNGLGRKATH